MQFMHVLPISKEALMSESQNGLAYCPRCGYLTLSLVAGRMLCGTQACAYEHDVTASIPIVRPEQ
jgi:hypothetical protein